MPGGLIYPPDSGLRHRAFDGEFMKIVDERLDRMIEIADKLDMPLDHVVQHMGRVDQRTFAALSESPSRLPRYMKSSVSP